MLYGDGIITPAILVLSAVQGLKVASVAFEPYDLHRRRCMLIGARVGKAIGDWMRNAARSPLENAPWWEWIASLHCTLVISAHVQRGTDCHCESRFTVPWALRMLGL